LFQQNRAGALTNFMITMNHQPKRQRMVKKLSPCIWEKSFGRNFGGVAKEMILGPIGLGAAPTHPSIPLLE
jgi:hypothetical protein